MTFLNESLNQWLPSLKRYPLMCCCGRLRCIHSSSATQELHSRRLTTPFTVWDIHVCKCVCSGIRVVWPSSVWQAWSAEITPGSPSPDTCCWVALNTRFCNYKSVIILSLLSFSPGAGLSVKLRRSPVLQLHLHTRPRGRPPTRKHVPTHTHTHTCNHTHRHSCNQPWWFVPLTLMLIETPCSKAWQCSATVVMMDQQSKNDVKKGFVLDLRGHGRVSKIPHGTESEPPQQWWPATAEGYTTQL